MKKMNFMSFIRLSAVVALIATVTVIVAMAVSYGDAVPVANQGAMPADVMISYTTDFMGENPTYTSYTSGDVINAVAHSVKFKLDNTNGATDLTLFFSMDSGATPGVVSSGSEFLTLPAGDSNTYSIAPNYNNYLYVHNGTDWYSYNIKTYLAVAPSPAYSHITVKGVDSVTLTVPTSEFKSKDANSVIEATFFDAALTTEVTSATGTITGSNYVFTFTDVFGVAHDSLKLRYSVTDDGESPKYSDAALPFYGEKATINVGSTPPTKVYDGTIEFDATNVASITFSGATGGASNINSADSITDPTVGFAFDSAAAGTNKTGSFNTAFALNNGFIMVNDPKTTFNNGTIEKRPITFTNGSKALTMEVMFNGDEINDTKLPLTGFLGTDGFGAEDFDLENSALDVTTVILRATAPDAAVTDNYDFANLTVTITKKIADPANPDPDSDYAKLANGNNLAPAVTPPETTPSLAEKAEYTGYSMDLGTGHNINPATVGDHRLLVTPGLVSVDDPAAFAIAFNSARSGLGFSTYTTFDMSLVDHVTNTKLPTTSLGANSVVFFTDAELTSMGVDISKELTMLHYDGVEFGKYTMHRVTGGFEVRGLLSLSPFVIYQAPDAVSSNNPAIAPNTGVYFG